MKFQPPLLIPFNLVKDSAFQFNSTAYWRENGTLYSQVIRGNLTFQGYVVDSVPAGKFTNAIQLHYVQYIDSASITVDTIEYDEFYGKNAGLLDDGDMILDSAFVDGVWYK